MLNFRFLLLAIFGLIVLTMAELPVLQPSQAQGQALALAQAGTSSRYEEKKRQMNENNAAIMTSGMTCTCASFAEDIRNVVNDLGPNGIRVLPIMGIGGLQNLKDVLFMQNMEMAIVSEDNMAALKATDPGLYADIEHRIHYITKLYNGELHILARNEIQTLADLNGKRVNLPLKDSQNDVTASYLFDMLNFKVERTYYDVETAIGKLKSGEIDASIMMTGAPQRAVAKLKKSDDLHFLSIDEVGLPGYDLTPVFRQYLPGELTHEQYPELIPEGQSVQTLVNRAMLVTYAWPENSAQYRKMARFVNKFFGNIDRFSEPGRHKKWREVNIWTEIPNWTRFKPAEEWLKTNKKTSAGPSDTAEKALRAFLAERQSGNATPVSTDEREALLKLVRKYLELKKNR
jgi:TRAP-type uncharacterized transport system substrate-binding protein